MADEHTEDLIDTFRLVSDKVFDLVWRGMQMMNLVKEAKRDKASPEMLHIMDVIRLEIEHITAQLMARVLK